MSSEIGMTEYEGSYCPRIFDLLIVGTGGFPQLLHIAHRWVTEEAFVFPTKVGSIIVAHLIGSTGRIKVFNQHQTTCLLQPQSFLELQGTHCCDRLEVIVET